MRSKSQIEWDSSIQELWGSHGRTPSGVNQKLMELTPEIDSIEKLESWMRLALHVWGEHLGHRKEGIDVLNQLSRQVPQALFSQSRRLISRSELVLRLGFEDVSADELAGYSTGEQATIFIQAGSGLIACGDGSRGAALAWIAFDRAKHLDAQDLAHRSLAIHCNNIASTLESRPELSQDEMRLMIESAHAARHHWGLAGGWREQERAEYRLSQAYLRALHADDSLKHARLCLEIVQKEGASAPLELYFAYEAIALALSLGAQQRDAEQAARKCKTLLNQLTSDDRAWCEGEFTRRLQPILGKADN